MGTLRLIVLGAAGRMGRRVLALSEAMDDVEVVGAVIRADDPRLGEDAGLVAGTNVLGVPLAEALPDVEADVVIDFSSPGGTARLVPAVAERGLPIVVATTGLDAEVRTRIVEASKHVAVMVAPNLSLGVALLNRLSADAAAYLGADADIEVQEVHHRTKRDAPSGTALQLARTIAQARGQDPDEVIHSGHRVAEPGERLGHISIHALRVGDVVGEHTVTFGFGSERLELAHKAHSRDVFARGSIRAAQFLYERPPGLYDVQDIFRPRAG